MSAATQEYANSLSSAYGNLGGYYSSYGTNAATLSSLPYYAATSYQVCFTRISILNVALLNIL